MTSDFQGTFDTHDLAFVLNDTPVPATLALLPIGLVGLLVVRPRRNHARQAVRATPTARRAWPAALAALCLLLPATLQATEARYGDPDAPLAGEVLGVQIRTTDPEELRYVVLQKLLERFSVEQGIEATPAEIDAYLHEQAKTIAQARRQDEARREQIRARLQSPHLSQPERERLEARLEMLDEILGADGAQTSPDVGADAASADEQAARAWVAGSFIRQWKVNRALHRQYGGRIVYQQTGPEPLDAYRLFLEDQQKQGAFRILDKTLAPGFWSYYTTDAKHSFYPAGSKEERNAFDAPPWVETLSSD